jgi:glycosyltransferase involved in cell wall biosynthesis
MNASPLPLLSVIIPTLNAAGVLGNCLRSIVTQDYPRKRVEILVADGGSTDETRSLAARHGARVLDNPRRIAEEGKRVALAAARGEYIIFMDADNEMSHPDFFRLSVQALRAHPQALGVESYYPAAPQMGSFCGYLTATLHISDPISWLMSVNPVPLGTVGEVERWGFPNGHFAYPLGANGFVYRRADLDTVGAGEGFEDTRVALSLALAGKHEWLRLAGRGVHHHVVKGVWDFTRKRRRQAYHFMSLRGRAPDTWTAHGPRTTPLLACLYCATFIGPLYHTLRGLLQTGDIRWLWHPVASLASLGGLVWGVATYTFSRKTADSEARLQPVQKIGGQP